MINPDELAAMKAREKAATKGPWVVGMRIMDMFSIDTVDREAYLGDICSEQDSEFIAHARQDIPKLLAEVERLQKIVDEW